MTWLTEIEDEATLALEGDEAFTGGYMDDLRMARVIRNMVAYITHESYTLSEDSMEVINDCAAPSST